MDSQTMLLTLARTARTFLLPHWQRWHEAWGPPALIVPSQWTCVRSSLLLTRAIKRHGTLAASLRSGKPVDELTNTIGEHRGLLTRDGWVSHAWVEADGFVIDVTADQFGQAPIIVTPIDGSVYRRAEDEACQLIPKPASLAAVDEIWPSWCSYTEGANEWHSMLKPEQ